MVSWTRLSVTSYVGYIASFVIKLTRVVATPNSVTSHTVPDVLVTPTVLIL
jgi:hypothetical protein